MAPGIATSAPCRSTSRQTPLSPCRCASASNVERANASGCPRPSSYRQTASSASPRPASSAATVAAVTPGWSPSISTSTSQRGSTTASAAAIEDEQPSPYASLTTTSAPVRSTPARTACAEPPIATTSWSKPHMRATPTTWPSSVPSRYGSSCLGRPRRLEPPAPSTRPQTNGSLRYGMLRLELRLATLAAEVDGLAVVLERDAARHGGDGHPADRVDRRDRRPLVAPHLHDPREDREGDLLRGAGADGEARRRVDAIEQRAGDTVAPQLADHALAAPAAGHEADVGQLGLEAAAQRGKLLAAVPGDDEREVVGPGL